MQLIRGLAVRNGRRVAVGLVALVGVAIVVSAGLIAARHEMGNQVDLLGRAIEVNALALHGATSQYGYLPFTVAQHPKILAALLSSKQSEANQYLQDVNRRAGSDALYLVNGEGKTVAASNWDTAQSFVGQDYSNRPYFTDAMNGHSGRFYGVGKTTGEPGYFISSPVRMDGRILGAVVVKVDLRRVQETWLNASSPIAVSDERGIFILGSVPQWLYAAARPLEPDEMAFLTAHEVYGKRSAFTQLMWETEALDDGGLLLRTSIDGKERRFVAVTEALPELGWTLTVTADYAVITKARNRAWMLSAMAVGLLVLGTLLWQTRKRQFDEMENQVRLRTHDLNQAHAFRKSMEDSLLVGMRARDLEGNIIYVNHALTQITGYQSEELIGRKPPYPYWHPDDIEKHWQDNEAALAGRAALTGFESRVRHRDGHDVHTMVYTAPLIDSEGKHSGWMSSVVDITLQKQVEARQQEQDERLRHVQRRAIMDEMASTLAHEINQPLLAIGTRAHTALILFERGDLSQLKSDLQAIEQQKQRASDIVQRIQDHVRQRTPGTEDCNINDLVRKVLAFMAPELRKRKTKVMTRLHVTAPVVRGDRVLLEQVLVNLIVNALQAMQTQEPRSRHLEIETTFSDDGLSLKVSDTGTGIPETIAEHIFRSFVTTRAEGLGIGLSICRTIIENLSG